MVLKNIIFNNKDKENSTALFDPAKKASNGSAVTQDAPSLPMTKTTNYQESPDKPKEEAGQNEIADQLDQRPEPTGD